MRITNSHVTGLSIGMASETPKTESTTRQPEESTVSDSSKQTQSAEMSNWLNLVRQSPAIRNEAVDNARELFLRGYFSTPESALRTADAILTSQE